MAEVIGLILNLRDKRRFVTDAKDASKATRGIGDAADRAGRTAQLAEGKTRRYGTALRVLRGAALAGTAALGVGLVRGVRASINAYAESEKVAAQTANAIKATGGVANVSAKQVGALALALQRESGISDEALASSQNLLLTFKAIRDEKGPENTFKRATKAALDMSVATGTDLRSASILLGKALQDPVKGASALRRTGSLSTVELEKLKNMAASGSTVFAQQAFILKALEGQYAGAAKAAGGTFAGSMNKAREEVDNLGEIVGGKLTPYIDRGARRIALFARQMQEGSGAGGRFVDFLRRAWPQVQRVAQSIGAALIPAGAGLLAVTSSLGGPLTLLGTLLRLAGEHTTTTKVAVVILTTAFVAYRLATLASLAVTKAHTAAQVVQANWTFIQTARSKGLRKALLVQGLTQGRATIASRLATVALVAQRAATIAATIATRALSLAMRLTPVGLVVTGLIAIGVGLVAAYRKFAWFRNLVQGTWSWIKANWPLLVAIITGPIGLAVRTVVRNFGRIKSAARAVIDFIVAQWERLPQPVRDFAGGKLPSLPTSVGGIPTGPSGLDIVRGVPGLFGQAEGGITRRPGLSLVGERGPELLSLPRAARVDPLPAPGPRETIVHTHVHLDGREIARSVNRHVRREAALA